jgi:hypothetical protein
MRMSPKFSFWWAKSKSDPAGSWASAAVVVMIAGTVSANAFRYLANHNDTVVILSDIIASSGVAICFGIAMWKAYHFRQHRRRQQYLWGSALGIIVALGATVFFLCWLLSL